MEIERNYDAMKIILISLLHGSAILLLKDNIANHNHGNCQSSKIQVGRNL